MKEKQNTRIKKNNPGLRKNTPFDIKQQNIALTTVSEKLDY